MPGKTCVGGRCNLHGGKSLWGMAHPRYKHGNYSKYSLSGLIAQGVKMQQVAERRQRREDAYVLPRLSEWADSQEGFPTVGAFMAMDRKLRREYQNRLAERRARRAWAKKRLAYARKGVELEPDEDDIVYEEIDASNAAGTFWP
jgi:hypothetical protein